MQQTLKLKTNPQFARRAFDDNVLLTFGLQESKEAILNAFHTLYQIRLAVK